MKQHIEHTIRKPDYRFKYMNKNNAAEEKGELGAAWKNADNTIRIVLNPKVSIRQHKDEVLMLFPV